MKTAAAAFSDAAAWRMKADTVGVVNLSRFGHRVLLPQCLITSPSTLTETQFQLVRVLSLPYGGEVDCSHGHGKIIVISSPGKSENTGQNINIACPLVSLRVPALPTQVFEFVFFIDLEFQHLMRRFVVVVKCVQLRVTRSCNANRTKLLASKAASSQSTSHGHGGWFLHRLGGNLVKWSWKPLFTVIFSVVVVVILASHARCPTGCNPATLWRGPPTEKQDGVQRWRTRRWMMKSSSSKKRTRVQETKTGARMNLTRSYGRRRTLRPTWRCGETISSTSTHLCVVGPRLRPALLQRNWSCRGPGEWQYKVSPPLLQELVDLCHKVCSQIGMSTTTVKIMWESHIKKNWHTVGIESPNGTTHAAEELFRTHDFSDLSESNTSTLEAVAAVRRCKIVFFPISNGICMCRVCKLDEMSCRLLPMGKHDRKGSWHKSLNLVLWPDAAVPRCPGDGHTAEHSLHEAHFPRQVQLTFDHSENHWINENTMLNVMKHMEKFRNEHTPKKACLLVLDVASIQTSAAFRSCGKEVTPWIHLYFVHDQRCTAARNGVLEILLIRSSKGCNWMVLAMAVLGGESLNAQTNVSTLRTHNISRVGAAPQVSTQTKPQTSRWRDIVTEDEFLVTLEIAKASPSTQIGKALRESSAFEFLEWAKTLLQWGDRLMPQSCRRHTRPKSWSRWIASRLFTLCAASGCRVAKNWQWPLHLGGCCFCHSGVATLRKRSIVSSNCFFYMCSIHVRFSSLCADADCIVWWEVPRRFQS